MITTYKEKLEKNLESYFNIEKYNLPKEFPKEIMEAMAYTTLLGGKRLRGILCLEACNIFSNNYEKALPLASALEMLHAQSLIHDDLPSMDNDDLRRGKPSNHKIFGEAIAILAGDALISLGAQIILESDVKNKEKITLEYLKGAGVFGIVGGQTLDILSEGKKIDIETLKIIHKYKTGALFESALVMGALAGEANENEINIIREFANKFGLAFQICDDILDVISTSDIMGKTLGKDEKNNKATYVTLFGVKEAKNKLTKTIKESYDILRKNNIQSKIFEDILDSITEKIKE
ncbi:MAG: polyprenyl synthetase family protein [Cyanobacteria bacterium SIG30]|nr:polyprenyl synthetase family protein [Cyanobacteria bacterium SIG30]